MGLKSVLCIQELSLFGYTQLSVSLRPSPRVSVCVCVCVKILNILKRKNSGLIPHWKMSELRGLKFVLCIQELGPFGYSQLLASLRFSPLLPMCVY